MEEQHTEELLITKFYIQVLVIKNYVQAILPFRATQFNYQVCYTAQTFSLTKPQHVKVYVHEDLRRKHCRTAFKDHHQKKS